MRSALKLGLVFFCLLNAFGTGTARAETDDNSSTTELISPEQGEALAAFALQSERRIRHPKPDCSHLVHLLYARAGLIYPYQDSRVLYRGVSGFNRVKTPQAGDLAVWLGHVGIVLSSQEKTFLSSVRSGIITESWTAPHWARRGRPRFYRYRIGPDTDLNLLASIMNDDSHPQVESLNTARSAASVPLPSSTTPTDVDNDADASQTERTDLSAQDPISRENSTRDPDSIVATITLRQAPNRQQIAAAIVESSKARAHQLIAGETLDLARPFSIFSRLEVEKLKIKHDKGSVTLEISEMLSQENGHILPARTTEYELAIIRKSDGVWMISDQRERTYLLEGDALEIFEHQAEFSLRRAPYSNNTRVMVKALDRLYDQQTNSPRRVAIR